MGMGLLLLPLTFGRRRGGCSGGGGNRFRHRGRLGLRRRGPEAPENSVAVGLCRGFLGVILAQDESRARGRSELGLPLPRPPMHADPHVDRSSLALRPDEQALGIRWLGFQLLARLAELNGSNGLRRLGLAGVGRRSSLRLLRLLAGLRILGWRRGCGVRVRRRFPLRAGGAGSVGRRRGRSGRGDGGVASPGSFVSSSGRRGDGARLVGVVRRSLGLLVRPAVLLAGAGGLVVRPFLGLRRLVWHAVLLALDLDRQIRRRLELLL
mmetsp:Transcript_114939/g.330069  ORF Transcript_114939/g.330069 Transcript_114939/m.330069 type:complete len:266 (+) Transcript_114939:1290-2087(+)